MTKYEIMVTLFTVVYGLMLTDLFFSLHKLIRKYNSIKWHWLPLLAAWYLFLIILKNWWDITSFENNVEWMNIIYFLAYGHLLVLIFLAVSSVLPDDINLNGFLLKEYYFSNHRYFWGIMSSIVFVALAIGIFKNYQLGNEVNYFNILANCILFLFTLILAISNRYFVHSVIQIILVVVVLFEILSKSI